MIGHAAVKTSLMAWYRLEGAKDTHAICASPAFFMDMAQPAALAVAALVD